LTKTGSGIPLGHLDPGDRNWPLAARSAISRAWPRAFGLGRVGDTLAWVRPPGGGRLAPRAASGRTTGRTGGTGGAGPPEPERPDSRSRSPWRVGQFLDVAGAPVRATSARPFVSTSSMERSGQGAGVRGTLGGRPPRRVHEAGGEQKGPTGRGKQVTGRSAGAVDQGFQVAREEVVGLRVGRCMRIGDPRLRVGGRWSAFPRLAGLVRRTWVPRTPGEFPSAGRASRGLTRTGPKDGDDGRARPAGITVPPGGQGTESPPQVRVSRATKAPHGFSQGRRSRCWPVPGAHSGGTLAAPTGRDTPCGPEVRKGKGAIPRKEHGGFVGLSEGGADRVSGLEGTGVGTGRGFGRVRRRGSHAWGLTPRRPDDRAASASGPRADRSAPARGRGRCGSVRGGYPPSARCGGDPAYARSGSARKTAERTSSDRFQPTRQPGSSTTLSPVFPERPGADSFRSSSFIKGHRSAESPSNLEPARTGSCTPARQPRTDDGHVSSRAEASGQRAGTERRTLDVANLPSSHTRRQSGSSCPS